MGSAPLPACFEAGSPDLEFYDGVCWYRRSFKAPSAWQGGRVALHFGAVNYRARVWLNGELLGENRDGSVRTTGPTETGRPSIVNRLVSKPCHGSSVCSMSAR